MIAQHLSAVNHACRQHGIVPTRYLLVVSIARQQTYFFERMPLPASEPTGFGSSGCVPEFVLQKTYRCSTSRFGVGEKAGSNMTPRGLHRICAKIGDGWPVGAVFKSREFVGYTWQGQPDALITSRILWLEGLEPGFNRGGDVDSRNRYIYIHGTGNPLTLGHPASHGCTHLADSDLVQLYSKVPVGTLVWITPR